MPFIVLAGGVPVPDAPSHLSSPTHAPGALEQICRFSSHTHTCSTPQVRRLPCYVYDTSPLGGLAWETALNHSGV